MRIWATIVAMAALGACNTAEAPGNEQDNGTVVLRNLVETDVAGRAPSDLRVKGTRIPTPSDTASRYFLLRERKTVTGTIVAIIRQERGDRVAYARAEVDCSKRLFHVLGVGDRRDRVEVDHAHDGPLRPVAGLPLREEMARYVCERSGTPLAPAA